MSFEGKVVVITGASSGIGRAIAILFSERKADLVLCGRDETRLNITVDRCMKISGSDGNNFLKLFADLSNPKERDSIIDKALSKFHKIDVLVCNAGTICELTPLLDTTEAAYDEIMEINVKSVFFLIKKAVPHLEKTKGNIVAVSAVSSHDTTPHIAYGASKAALDHMMRCCAPQFGPKGIRVNVVNPTFVERTRIRRHMMPEQANATDEELANGPDPFLDAKALLHPLENRVATPEDIASAVAFFASDEAKFITGQILDVDGGVTVESKTFPSQ